MLREAVVAIFRHLLEGQRKGSIELSPVILCSGQSSKIEPPEHKSEASSPGVPSFGLGRF
jgi:hypothetical protein